MQYLKILVEDIHSVVIATNDQNGRPVTPVSYTHLTLPTICSV